MSIFKNVYYVPYEWWDKNGQAYHGSVELTIFKFFMIDISQLKCQIRDFIVEDTEKEPTSIKIISLNKM